MGCRKFSSAAESLDFHNLAATQKETHNREKGKKNRREKEREKREKKGGEREKGSERIQKKQTKRREKKTLLLLTLSFQFFAQISNYSLPSSHSGFGLFHSTLSRPCSLVHHLPDDLVRNSAFKKFIVPSDIRPQSPNLLSIPCTTFTFLQKNPFSGLRTPKGQSSPPNREWTYRPRPTGPLHGCSPSTFPSTFAPPTPLVPLTST